MNYKSLIRIDNIYKYLSTNDHNNLKATYHKHRSEGSSTLLVSSTNKSPTVFSISTTTRKESTITSLLDGTVYATSAMTKTDAQGRSHLILYGCMCTCNNIYLSNFVRKHRFCTPLQPRFNLFLYLSFFCN